MTSVKSLQITQEFGTEVRLKLAVLLSETEADCLAVKLVPVGEILYQIKKCNKQNELIFKTLKFMYD